MRNPIQETDEDSEQEISAETGPNRQMLDEFREYCDTHSDAFLPFTRAQKTSIRLLATLKMKKSPLNTFLKLFSHLLIGALEICRYRFEFNVFIHVLILYTPDQHSATGEFG